MATFVHKLNQVDAPRVFAAVAEQPYALFLDSADRAHNAARYSFIAFDPVEKITLAECGAEDPFAFVQKRLDAWKKKFAPEYNSALPPFQGGAAGLFSYDLGRRIEKLPDTAKHETTPDLAIGIYNKVVAFDHKTNEAWLIVHGDKKNVEIAEKEIASHTQSLNWKSQSSAADYKARVARVIEYIRAGDIFQANLSQAFEARLPRDFDAFAHYLHLRDVNPAPFAAYMNLGDTKISSASPERFLRVENGRVETRPIKGTARRESDKNADRFKKIALENSAKDRAENTMIVDLLRNDLSKVCAPESINVPSLCKLESFARVHHLVSTVTGKLAEGKTALDLLRACFPGGSITGAPKIRAQEIIEELESSQRGAYCGAIGYIGFNGAMDTNILIRTLIYKNDTVRFNTGGGIVADSDPESEYQETLDKADAIFRSFSDGQKAKTA